MTAATFRTACPVRRAAAWPLAVALWSMAVPAVAATHPVDDSASQVLKPSVAMKWDDPVATARGGVQAGVTGQVAVLVRLNVSRWKGQNGRLYLTVPAPASGPLTVGWSTRGPLLPGSLRAGERALVFSGTLPTDLLEDTLLLTLRADGNQLVRPERLTFSFEIDTP